MGWFVRYLTTLFEQEYRCLCQVVRNVLLSNLYVWWFAMRLVLLLSIVGMLGEDGAMSCFVHKLVQAQWALTHKSVYVGTSVHYALLSHTSQYLTMAMYLSPHLLAFETPHKVPIETSSEYNRDWVASLTIKSPYQSLSATAVTPGLLVCWHQDGYIH